MGERAVESQRVGIGRTQRDLARGRAQQPPYPLDEFGCGKHQARIGMREGIFEVRILSEEIQRRNDIPCNHRAQQQRCGGGTVGQHE